MNKKVFVSGSRYYNNKEIIKKELLKYKNDLIIVGDCYGVDYEVMKVCKELNIKCVIFYIGNCRNNVGFKSIKVKGYNYIDKDIMMSKLCDEGLVFWNGNSKGSKNNIDRLKRMNKEVKIIMDK